jgi:hypothetical protein
MPRLPVPGSAAVVRALVHAGADVNAAAGVMRCTPLRRARNCRKPELVRLLLSRGAAEPSA